MNTRSIKTILTLSASALVGSAPLHGAAVIYEPFDDADATLDGNASGTGLTGTWSAGAFGVTTGSMSWGSLQTSGNRALSSGNRFKNAFADPGTTLSGAGLLNDGAELWFSALATSVSNSRTYIALGNGAADGFDRIGGGPGGFGLGIRLENGSAYTHGWDDNSAIKPAGATVADGSVFVVGKITWAASGSNDTLELFLPGTDLVLPGTAASTMTRDFDQSIFNTISFAGGNRSDIPEVDEIRFGASYLDVAPVPEPASMSLLALAGLGLLRRRR